MSAITRQIALQTSFEMGQLAAERGRHWSQCPLTDPDCIARWHAGYDDVCGEPLDPMRGVEFPFAANH